MRHFIAHGYDVIEYAVIWDTIKNNLPDLVRKLNAIVGTHGDERETDSHPAR